MIKCECTTCKFNDDGYCDADFQIHIGIGEMFGKTIPICSDYEKKIDIEVGDEVTILNPFEKIRIYVTEVYSDCISGFAICNRLGICEFGDRYSDISIDRCQKTGRHFKDFRDILRELTGEEE